MNIGKMVRLNRLFAHPSGRFCSTALDHFIGYDQGLPDGLRKIQTTLEAIVSARPDAVTMHKGIALSAWAPHAGRVPLILQSMIARVDDSACEALATPEDAVRLGADAFAVAIFVRGSSEAAHLRIAADFVRQAAQFEMPVICHIYPRDYSAGPKISYRPEDIAWAVRCAVETGVDVIKVPYCGDVAAYAQIAQECPLPLVAAGGPKADTLENALDMIAEVVRSGARGATIGRNIWGFPNIAGAVLAFKAVIHDLKTTQDALKLAAG